MSSTPPSSAWLRMFTSCNCDTPTCHLFCVLIIITWHTNNKNTSMLNVLHYSNTPTCYLFYEKIFLFNGSEEYIWTLLLTLIVLKYETQTTKMLLCLMCSTLLRLVVAIIRAVTLQCTILAKKSILTRSVAQTVVLSFHSLQISSSFFNITSVSTVKRPRLHQTTAALVCGGTGDACQRCRSCDFIPSPWNKGLPEPCFQNGIAMAVSLFKSFI